MAGYEASAYLQLDLDDVVLSGVETEFRLCVVDKAGNALDPKNVGGNVGGHRFVAERSDDGWWLAQLPRLEEGVALGDALGDGSARCWSGRNEDTLGVAS